MTFKKTAKNLAIGLAMAACLFPVGTRASDGTAPHWSYEGHGGPEHWGTLDPKWVTCSEGKTQSPVDLKWSKSKGDGKIEFSYQGSPLKLIDNGHTLQVNFEPGSKVNLRGQTYELVQMHFHTTSEHTFSGKSYPLELHFVHKNAEGKLAVVGVMFEVGAAHPGIQALWDQWPTEKGAEKVVSGVQVNPQDFLPSRSSHYHYWGSLTTPPCSEGVNWNVLNTPLQISKEQLARFTKTYAHNSRPVQPLFGRKPANF